MRGHNIHIELNDEQEQFLKLMAKRDKVSVKEELLMMLDTEFRNCEDLYGDELKGDTL